MPRRKVFTFDGVIEVLGGLKAVAAMTGVAPVTVCRWRRNRGGRFPARTVANIKAELSQRGAFASRDLYDFDPPRSYDDDKHA